jgi:prepilin-type N-terminal cleavage/methylation domain-containing protein
MHKQRGFTIVELLIVIVVVAILAAITIVAYNGIQNRSKSAQFLAAIDAYVKAAEIYKIENGDYPATPQSPGTNAVCLGDYPAANGFNAGGCLDAGGMSIVTADSGVNDAFNTVIDPLPQTASIVTDLGGASNRGIIYGYDPAVQQGGIYYYINGDQECGRGAKTTDTIGGNPVTVCSIEISS